MRERGKVDAETPLAGPDTPGDRKVAMASEFDPVARVYRAAWVIDHAHVHRVVGDPASAPHADISSVERQPFAEDGTRLIRARPPRSSGSGQELSEGSTIGDGLTLERLYARFNAIARGWAVGNSSAAHRSIVERLAANQTNAVALGWSNFLVARRGGTGRLELHGSRTPGQDRELVPDQIPWR